MNTKRPQTIITYSICIIVLLLLAYGTTKEWKFVIKPCTITYDNPITIKQAVIVNNPYFKGNNQIIDIKAKELGHPQWCKVRIYSPNLSLYQKNDILQATIKPQQAKPFENIQYKEFLKAQGIDAIAYRPTISIVKATEKRSAIRIIEQRIEEVFPEPYQSITKALLLGRKSSMPEFTEQYIATAGISHIFAISGLHIMLLQSGLLATLLFIKLKKNKAWIFSAITMTTYVLLIGAPSSATRALLMGLATAFALKSGKIKQTMLIIIIVATVMALFNPYLILYSPSYQFSFLATIGIVKVSELHKKKTRKKEQKKQRKIIKYIQESLIMTSGAMLLTWPLIIYYFKHISLVGFIANIIIIPVLPIIMIILMGTILCGEHCRVVGIITIETLLRMTELLASMTWAIL